ncbi:hypothetical protein DTO169E5_1393 [Paecilomyces variotii]|nr:hypothetical protein DTO169E5_1393 [Paecilomyces variotii]KAJ9290303.1 hypothetical protein DTO021C3_1927 [Paecilomyces variotii]
MAVQDSCRHGSAILRLLRLAATFNDDVMLALKMTYLPCNGESSKLDSELTPRAYLSQTITNCNRSFG